MGPGVWWSESCSVGLVWSGDHGFSSFPFVAFFFLAVFCVKNRGYDDRSMRSTCPVVGLILLPFVDWILAKTQFAKHLGQCFWSFGGLGLVLLAWCGVGATGFVQFLVLLSFFLFVGFCDFRLWESRFWTSNRTSCIQLCPGSLQFWGLVFRKNFGSEHLCAFYFVVFSF